MDVVEPVDVGGTGGTTAPARAWTRPGSPRPARRRSATSWRPSAGVSCCGRRCRTAGYGGGALCAVLLLLALIAASIGPAAFWPGVTAGVLGRRSRWSRWWSASGGRRAQVRHDRAAARRAGVLIPELASDLLSAVELADLRPPIHARRRSRRGSCRRSRTTSRAASAPMDARQLVPLRPAARAIAAGGRGDGGGDRGWWLSPMVARGLRTLVHRPSLFEGAAISAVPLVGDVRITYSYPRYTGLPPAHRRRIDGRRRGGEGDARAHRDAPAARRDAARCCCWASTGEKGELAASLSGNTLIAELTLNEDASYRFWLEPPLGRAVREARSHHLTVEADAAPRVEILGPADRLELATPRPIEIGYSATDDYGVGTVELVFRAGDRPEQRVLLRDGGGARTVQGRTLWDPASAGLGSAQRIAYRIEARDRDDVSPIPAGSVGKAGTSRTLYVMIQNPHESLEDRLERQRDLLEKFIADLANRLERGPNDDVARRAGGVCGACTTPRRRTSRCSASSSTRIGGTGRWARRCARTLTGIADRLERLLRDEAKALAALKGKRGGRPGPAGRAVRQTRRRAGERRAAARRSDRPAAPRGSRGAGQGADRRPPAAARSARALSEDEGSGAAPPARTRGARAARASRRARRRRSRRSRRATTSRRSGETCPI